MFGMSDWPEPTMSRSGITLGTMTSPSSKGRGLPSSELRAWSASQGHPDPARQLLHDGHRGVVTIESDRDSRLRDRDGVDISSTFLGKYGCGSVTAIPVSTIPRNRHQSVHRDNLRSCRATTRDGDLPDSQGSTMTVPNKKLIAAVEAYFTELRRVCASGAGPERAPAIRHWNPLFLAGSGMGSSQVRCTPKQEISDQLTTALKCRSAPWRPRRPLFCAPCTSTDNFGNGHMGAKDHFRVYDGDPVRMSCSQTLAA